jgi:hypothetical protein
MDQFNLNVQTGARHQHEDGSLHEMTRLEDWSTVDPKDAGGVALVVYQCIDCRTRVVLDIDIQAGAGLNASTSILRPQPPAGEV